MKAIKIYVEGENGVKVLNNLKAVYGKIAERIVLSKLSSGARKWDFGTDKYEATAKFYDVADEGNRRKE